MSDKDDIRETINSIPGLRVMGEAEMTAFLDQMQAHHNDQPDEPAKLPLAPIDYIPKAVWDDKEENPLRLITPEQFHDLPDGTLLVSIAGKAKIKGLDDIDLDTRYGCIAWGFRESQLAEEP